MVCRRGKKGTETTETHIIPINLHVLSSYCGIYYLLIVVVIIIYQFSHGDNFVVYGMSSHVSAISLLNPQNTEDSKYSIKRCHLNHSRSPSTFSTDSFQSLEIHTSLVNSSSFVFFEILSR